MKRFVLAVILVFVMSGIAFASATPYYASGNTVSFNTAALVVTFNTIVDKIYIKNETMTGSPSLSVSLTGQNIGWGYDGVRYTMPSKASGDTVLLANNTSITYEAKTDKIGFIGSGNGTVTYLVTSERKQP